MLQRRRVAAGETVGYNATWTAPADTEVAILNIGYADGYWRGFSGRGRALHDGAALPVLGRVSMDLIAVDVTGRAVAEGDWLEHRLRPAARVGGVGHVAIRIADRARAAVRPDRLTGRWPRCWDKKRGGGFPPPRCNRP